MRETKTTIRIRTPESHPAPFLKARQPDPCAMVLFGITGDLAHRKLMPALYNLAREGLLPEHFALVGFSSTHAGVAELRAALKASEGAEGLAPAPLPRQGDPFGPPPSSKHVWRHGRWQAPSVEEAGGKATGDELSRSLEKLLGTRSDE